MAAFVPPSVMDWLSFLQEGYIHIRLFVKLVLIDIWQHLNTLFRSTNAFMLQTLPVWGRKNGKYQWKPCRKNSFHGEALLVVELPQTKHCTYLTDNFLSVWSKLQSPFTSPDASTCITKRQFLGRCLSCARRAGRSGRGTSDHADPVTREPHRARHAGHNCWSWQSYRRHYITHNSESQGPCIPTGEGHAEPCEQRITERIPLTERQLALHSAVPEFLPGDEGFPHQWPQLISTGRTSIRTPKQGHGLNDKRTMLSRPHTDAGPARPAATLWLQPSNADQRTQGSASRSFWKHLEAKQFKTIHWSWQNSIPHVTHLTEKNT